jgi:hypothetical protein
VQDLKWDLACGGDPEMRKIVRRILPRPSTAPARMHTSLARAATLPPGHRSERSPSQLNGATPEAASPMTNSGNRNGAVPAPHRNTFAVFGSAGAVRVAPNGRKAAQASSQGRVPAAQPAPVPASAPVVVGDAEERPLPMRDWRQPGKWVRPQTAAAAVPPAPTTLR